MKRFQRLWLPGLIFFLSPLFLFGQEPMSQTTSLSVSNLGSGSLFLSWTRGDGDFVLVVGRETTNAAQAPSDDTSFTADEFLGSGSEVGTSTNNFVVFLGTGTSTIVRGLTASTGYSFEAYEFNTGGVPNDPDYLTGSPASVSTTTSAALSLYSFQSGDAEDADTWTTDASGETLVNSAVPGAADDVTILVNRTVTVNVSNFDAVDMRIDEGAVLALGTTTGNDFTTMSGTGLVTAATEHPNVTTNDFGTSSGGTFEYVSSAGSITLSSGDEANYNNLIIDNTTVTAGLDLTVNGSLTIENSGTLNLGDGTVNNRTYTFDDITIDGTSTIATNATSTTNPHTATITGNLTNNGTVDFTAQSSSQFTSDPTVGVVEVTFTGTESQTLSCSGNTDFYRLIVDKGDDQTATLTVSSTSTSNFRIFGRNNEANTDSGDDANPTSNKALWIKNGTLELGSNISLLSLTEGGDDFFIPANGALHINGATVRVTGTGNGTTDQDLRLVGKLQITSGSYLGSNTGGIVYAGSAELDIDGGSITISQLRASTTTIGTANALAYNQSAGSVTINGGGTESASHARIDMEADNLTDARNSFTMSGGTLTISNPNDVAGISIITRESDFTTTGGTVRAQVTETTNFGIAVNGAFFDLTLQEDGNGADGDIRTVDDGPITMTELKVGNDLVLTNGVTLNMQGDDLTVGGDITLNSGTTYTPGTNTTTFNGSGSQAIVGSGTISGNLNSLTINKSAGTFTANAAYTINADLNITSGTFADGGFTHTVAGNVTNSATHSGSGAISLTGTATQTIGGDGNGVFQNLTLNNTNAATAPISTTAQITVDGTLTFSNDKLLDIGTNSFVFGSSASVSGANSSRFIQTSGASEAAGVTKTFSSTGSFTWHIGTETGTVYTPATISVSSASSTGTITIVPVSEEHPNVTFTGTALTYYWAVTSSGWTSVSGVTHSYTYDDSDIVGNESEYVYGQYNTSTNSWTSGAVADVTEGSNLIGGAGTALDGVSFFDGEFTAGDNDPNDPFGAVTIFFSRNDAPNITTTGADWDTDDGGNKTTWSINSHSGSVTTSLPEDVQGSQVIIASGHIVDVSSNTKSAGGLELNGTLDLSTTTGHDLGTVSGAGTLRISSAAATAEFPTGDFSTFTGTSGGTVVYYKNAAQNFTLPSSPTSYRNLNIETGTGSSAGEITMPAADLSISNDFTITDGSGAGQSGEVLIAQGNNFSVGNDLILTSENSQNANLTFQSGGSARAISVTNDLTLGTNNTVQVENANALAHTLTISGSLTNNGTFDLVPSTGTSVATTFSGSTSTSITGTGSNTDFGAITIDKGSSSASELNVNATSFTLSSLTLTNGSFRLTSAQTITPSTTTFEIPSTARLATSGGTINLSTGADNGNDVLLGGEIEIVSGAISIGTDGNNSNNDIEYAASGTPTIDVQGGTLTVNGQIRRGTATTVGDLTYSQSAGTVNINGRNAEASRAMLEVDNSGSFTMSSGNLNILRGGGTTFNDLYLHPSSSSVTGGTISFTPGTAGNQTFSISSTISLNDVSVVGNGASNTASLTVNDQALSVNDLTLSEANSSLDANGFGLNIAGDFTNSGTFTSNSNTTTFNGSGAQAFTINTATAFHNLTVNKSAETLTLSGSADITVANDLTLTSGTMEDGGRTITVTGNVSNSATHTSGTVGTGGISLTDADHAITGAGTFGNLTLTGTSRTVTVGDPITLNADLDFTGTVVLEIDENDLTFGSLATITGSSFGSSKMIRTAANNDIVKNFPASATDFTFPVGIGTDYTPARTNLTTNTNTGSITLNVFNVRHPLTNDAADTELLRYWTLATSGLSGAVATLVFTYVETDVQGDESSYVTGTVVSGDWSPAGGTGSTVDDTNNTITLTGTSTIAAEFTAGLTAEFSGVDTYFSRTTGNWEDASTWSIIGHDGAATSSPPNGHNVEISADHDVTVTADGASAFSLVLGGTIDLGSTIGHSFGSTTGSGTMQIEATASGNFNFPSSDISGFTGTHEYTGTTDGNMLSTPENFHNLTFTGASVKNLQNTNFGINNTFSMSAGTVNQTTSSTVSLSGDFSNTGATFNDTAGTLDFSGTGAQSITASGGSTTFNNITISNSAGNVTVNNNIDMNGTFTQNAGTTLDMDDRCIGGTGTLNIGGEVQTSNTNGLSGGATTTFENTTTVNLSSGSNILYDAAGAQTVSARTDYDGLQVGGSGTKSLDGDATVGASLNIAAGDLTIGSNTLTLNGTVTGVGEITGSATSNITIGGTGDLGTIDFASGANTLNDLTLNRTSSGTIDFEEDFTIDNSVTFTDGIVNLPINTSVTLGSSGVPATVTGGSSTAYFNTDPVDDTEDTDPDIDFFLEDTELEIPLGFNPFASIRLSCPSCSGHRFIARVTRGPYNTPPRADGRETTNVVQAQWALRRISGSLPVDVTITLCWSSSLEGTGLGTNVGISVWDSNDANPFWDIGNSISAKSGSGPFCQSRTITIDGTGRYFLAVANDQSPLPVTLLSFSGRMNDEGNIDLVWETADEVNNSFFEVQRSQNGLEDWEALDFVPGSGNSQQVVRYTYTDDQVNKDRGFLYYRLRQVDFNGEFEFSPVIAVPINSALFNPDRSWRVFPNPTDGNNLQMVLTDARFSTSDSFRFRLIGSQGTLLMDEIAPAENGAEAVNQKLAFSGAGVYILEIYSGGRLERHRLIKQ